MKIIKILEIKQPEILRELLEKRQYVEQPEFPEDDYKYREIERLMKERKAVEI